jgi:hypothetical protein
MISLIPKPQNSEKIERETSKMENEGNYLSLSEEIEKI